MFEPVHLYTNRLNRDFNVFLLLIPTVVFILVLATLYLNYKKVYKRQEIATEFESTSTVLGEESEFDKAKDSVQN